MKPAILRRRPPPPRFAYRGSGCRQLLKARTRVVLDQLVLEHCNRHNRQALSGLAVMREALAQHELELFGPELGQEGGSR
jgi:hypothetical protein